MAILLPKVKFCGMTRPEDLNYALHLGIDYLGIIIEYPPSPRSLSLDQSLKLFRSLKKEQEHFPVRTVAVVVNPEWSLCEKLIDSGLVDVLQFHGDEKPRDCGLYSKMIEVWKAVSANEPIETLRGYEGKAQRILLDSGNVQEKARGGTGVIEFERLSFVLNQVGCRLVLAGGLSPDNIQAFILRYRPEIIDVSRGIETAPGCKDSGKMKRFIELLRNCHE